MLIPRLNFALWAALRCLLLAGLLVANARASRNQAAWDRIDLPATGVAGQTIRFSARVLNAGDTAWDASYYAELKDQAGLRLAHLALGGTRSGAVATGMFSLKLPAQPGTYAYHFSVVQPAGAALGPAEMRTIVVTLPQLDVQLAVDDVALTPGEVGLARSSVSPASFVLRHGLQGRSAQGEWETWAAWNDPAGSQPAAFPGPARAGRYEVRAYAVRTDDTVAYSAVLPLSVNAIPPAFVSEPASVIAQIGDTVTFSARATGTEPLYQWQKDGVNLPGANAATLVVPNAQPLDNGTYTVTVANEAGAIISRPVTLTLSVAALPAIGMTASHFPSHGARQSVPLTATRVGDVITLTSGANLTAGTGWRHEVLIRRPAVAGGAALPPEDGSGLHETEDAWNRDGWGAPHDQSGTYDPSVTGAPATDLGRREPFTHALVPGQTSSTRSFDFVLDAPGTWTFKTEIVDARGNAVAASPSTTVTVDPAPLAGDPAEITYPYGRTDRFVGVFWNAGQAHRLWSTWRADQQSTYRANWATNWKLMWQPSPYFRGRGGDPLVMSPLAESPWQPFWSAHQVYAMVPDGLGGSLLSHDLTSQAFAEKAALRLMDVGVDFVAVDYTNQFLEVAEDVFPAVNNLALAFQAVAPRSQSGQRIKLTAVVPANVGSGDWGGNGGFVPSAIAKFNAKLTTIYNRFARFEAAWFHLEDDNGTRKPLLLLWVGASGEGEPDGRLAPARLSQLRLADGRALTDVFTIRWVGAYMTENPRFLTGENYAVAGGGSVVAGKYLNPKFWSYREHFPAGATVQGSGANRSVEAVTVQPDSNGRDRFGRAWQQNWPPGEGFHYETPARPEPIRLDEYGRIWRESLAVARNLNPKFLLTTWAEFGSENDEPRPEMSVTIMDNNKFGTHFGDALKDAVRLFKYRAPQCWVDTYAHAGVTNWFARQPSGAWRTFPAGEFVELQGWVSPNVATTFADGSVKIYLDDQLHGVAEVGGAWNGATRWVYTVNTDDVGPGRHTIRIVAEDGVGGASAAGVQFLGEPPTSVLPFVVGEVGGGPTFSL
ncbi:MAG TPA: immunoglobulin domain-containing protein [Opitutaceae bacterium]|nr:immunoglobulin domain-containing protein [Opitutaceae bacterium]